MTQRDESSTSARIDDPEVPEEDAIEQRTDAVETTGDEEPEADRTVEADPADVAEQSRTVELDDDEYR